MIRKTKRQRIYTSKSRLQRSGNQRQLRFEPLEERRLLAASPWQNPVDPNDVNGDGVVSLVGDVLTSYNALNATGPRTLPLPASSPPYLDVNGDGDHTPNDLVRVVNALNSLGAGAGFTGGASVAGFTGTIQVRFETTDLAGNPITSTPVGSSFLLRTFVEDGSVVPAGVFAGYVDVAYDQSIAAVKRRNPLCAGCQR